MRITIPLATGALALGISATASAQPSEYGPYHRPPYVAGKDEARPDYVKSELPSKHNHDGFYFRFAGGGGGGYDAAEAASSVFQREDPSSGAHYSASASSLGGATEAAIGYTLVHGLVLGAGAYTTTLGSLQANGTGIGDGSYTFHVSQIALFSPVLDWYFDPHNGFHAQAGFGFATYVAGTGVPRSWGPAAHAHTALGTGLMLGVGYEWWLSDEWSLGILGRVLRADTSGNDAEGVAWTHTTTTYALLASVTYN